jgi:hypothetical protein
MHFVPLPLLKLVPLTARKAAPIIAGFILLFEIHTNPCADGRYHYKNCHDNARNSASGQFGAAHSVGVGNSR